MAWGRPWPTTTCTIHRHDFSDETDETDGDEDADHIPAEETFTCLLNVDLLRSALGIAGKFSVIVIREEYEFLRELFGKKDRPFIVTGHPGTGKTVFLLYLLIYRLEHELTTAVQLSPNIYIIFKADGVLVCRSNDEVDTDHRRILPTGCWCLSDGNANVADPCIPFQREDLRTFLITSPRLERYKKWCTQAGAQTVVTTLPRRVEVAAIAQMHEQNPHDAVSIMRKWGPCTRTVLAILRDPDEEDNFESYAKDAATDIYHNPEKVSLRDVGQLPSGLGSTLLFIRPVRRKDKPTYFDSKFIIPTIHLSEIFDEKCQGLSTQNRMELYEFFSTHPITTRRTPAGWLHEKNMHIMMNTKITPPKGPKSVAPDNNPKKAILT